MNASNVLCSLLLSHIIKASVIAIESPSRSSSCDPVQRDALSRFNQSFSVSGSPLFDSINFCVGTPKTASWRKDEDCCSWEGVTCDNSTGNIVGLDLYCAGFRGAIDSSSSLFSLYHLRSLNLLGNHFTGILPPEIAQLSKLVSLDLSNSGLEIQNPTMRMLIRNLTELEEINLSNTDMSAVTPPSLMNFSSSLTSLLLHDCSLGGKFPDYIFQLPNIQAIGLSRNSHLSGTLPGFNWSSTLSSLYLADCSFTGEVPHSIGNLPRLTYLDISGNNFTGQLDLWTFSTLENLLSLTISGLSVDATDGKPKFPKLDKLRIVEGKLKNFPCFLSSMPELRGLYLERSIVSAFPGQCINNGLSFPKLDTLRIVEGKLENFPCFLSSMPELRGLFIQRSIVSEFPGQCVNNGLSLLQLQSLAVRFCNLTKFPSFFSHSKELRYLDLSGNMIEEIPGWFGVILTDLQSLDLSNNWLTGRFPLPSYATIYYSVSKNYFTGEIPSLMCNATNLLLLDLSNNGLTGTLPRCLKNITKQLLYLNLQVNKFHGLIPEIFPEGSNLSSLDFSMNQFEGSLPRSLSNCQNLEVLKVGSNKIVDSFPNWLGDLPLRILSLRSNELHGPVSISGGTRPFSRIRILDLSNNNFDSNLPENLISGMFDMTLDNSYRAGSNAGDYMVSSFSYQLGQFFSVMIDMKGVEGEREKINAQFAMLDLSSNRFHGEIPRSIGLLNSLTGLNFSHNGFTGTIPPSLGDLRNLDSLDLSSNDLVGEIPNELVKLSFLGALNLSWNNLTGAIPVGGHFNTFPNSSFEGNPGLCGIPLTRECSQGRSKARPPPNQRDHGEDETGGWLEWKYVAMGFGSGIGIGITLGYMALETGRPLWLARMVIRLEALGSKKMKRKAPRRNARR